MFYSRRCAGPLPSGSILAIWGGGAHGAGSVGPPEALHDTSYTLRLPRRADRTIDISLDMRVLKA